MKKNEYMLLAFLFLNISGMHAQEITVNSTVIHEQEDSIYTTREATPFFCGYSDEVQPDILGLHSYSTDQSMLNTSEIIVFNIYFWNINPETGVSGNPLLENEALEIVAEVNRVYNPLRIFFKYIGIGSYASANHYISDSSLNLLAEARDLGFYDENAFNIYMPFSLTYACGVGSPNSNSITLAANCITPNRTVHEIGHNFGLSHTHANWRTPGILCENVTRDTTNPIYNANVAGDFVADTAAAPNFLIEHYIELKDAGITDPSILSNYERHKYIDPVTCQYDNSNGVGFNDQVPYEIFEEDVRNYMGYGFDDCRALYSPGQNIKMRETIDNDVLGVFQSMQTDVASLYEPYKGTYYFSGPITEDNIPLFQPGFDYAFYDCSGNFYDTPADYDESFDFTVTIVNRILASETNYESITHPNHSAIQISQVDSALGWSQVKKCYDNNNLSPIGGVVIKFEDDILNQRIRVIPKSALEINDVTLVNSLQKGLYKIEKHYPDGTRREKILYKRYE